MRVIQNIVRHIIAVGFWCLHFLINLTFASVLLLTIFYSLLIKATSLSSIRLRVSFLLFYLALFRSFIRINSLNLVRSNFIYWSIRLRFLSLMLMMVGFTHSSFKLLTGLRWVWVTLPIRRWLSQLRYVFCIRIWGFWCYVEIQGFECTLVLRQNYVFWNWADILLLNRWSWRKLCAISNIRLICRKILFLVALGVNFDLWIV